MRDLVDMKSWTARRFVRFSSTVTVLAFASWMVVSLNAGEAIQFSNAKARPDPGAQNKLVKDKLSTVDRIPSSNPFDTVNSASPARDERRKPKTREEKRRALAKVENENWTQVEKGQLQEEEEEKTAFGVRDYDLETAGKEKTTTDIWFSTKNNNNAPSSGNGRPSGPSARGSAPNRPRPAPESGEKESGLKLGKAGSKQADQSAAGPPSGDRSSQNILGPEIGLGKLNDTFSGPPGDQTRGDLGLRSIDTPSGTRAPGLGLGSGEILGFGRDPGTKPALSGSPLLMDSPKSQPSGLFSPPGGSGSGFGLSGNRFGSSPFGEAGPASRSGFGSAPALQPQPRNSLTPGSSRDPFAPPPRPSSGR
jgi:hypothetical protein